MQQVKKLKTVKNKEDGTVTFSELSFDNTKVGTHTYTVEEVIPATKELGMTYDTMKATLTVEVAKKWTYPNNCNKCQLSRWCK